MYFKQQKYKSKAFRTWKQWKNKPNMGERATRAQTSESDFSVSLNLNFHECSNYFTQQMNLYILIKYYWSYSFNETNFLWKQIKGLHKQQRWKSFPTLEFQSMPISDWHYEFCLINHTCAGGSTRVSRAPEFALCCCSVRLVNWSEAALVCCSLCRAACAGSASAVFCGTPSALDTETGSWRPPAHIWSVRHELQ